MNYLCLVLPIRTATSDADGKERNGGEWKTEASASRKAENLLPSALEAGKTPAAILFLILGGGMGVPPI